MLNNFYKVIYNFYISKNEKDIPHIYAVAVMSVLEICNIITFLMIINVYKEFISMNKGLAIGLSVTILIFNLIYYYKFANRTAEIFNIDKDKKRHFGIYLLATIAFFFGIVLLKGTLHKHW